MSTNQMLEEFKKVVQSRRSVRIFDGTPIPENVVSDCLDMALLAPNSSNLQPWEFYWVKSTEAKKQLVEACLSQPAAKTAAELIVCVARNKSWPKATQLMLETFEKRGLKVPDSAKKYYKVLLPFALTQGYFNSIGFLKKLIVTVRGVWTPTPRGPASYSDMRVWSVKSCALACENLMLSFRAYDFDTCPMEGFDEVRVRKLLSLPRDAEVVMVVGAGKRSPKGIYGPQIRFDRSLFVKEV